MERRADTKRNYCLDPKIKDLYKLATGLLLALNYLDLEFQVFFFASCTYCGKTF